MLNNVTIMGRLCAEPELRKTASGISVCNARIAVERDYTDGNGERETDFFSVVAWRGTADFLSNYFDKGRKVVAWRGTADFLSNYFDKGRKVVVSGRLQTRTWTDQENHKRVTVEIVAESVYFADSKPTEATGEAPAKGSKRKAA